MPGYGSMLQDHNARKGGGEGGTPLAGVGGYNLPDVSGMGSRATMRARGP
jgi:hypothetical protein